MPRFLLLALACGVLRAALPTGAETARALKEAGLDPQACYRVRDLSYYKDDVKLYLNEGYLIFSRPVQGTRFAAMFVGEVEGGDGEILLLAPSRAERMSLAKYTESPNLNEHFRSALLLFTDGAGERLLDDITNGGRGRLAPEMGPPLADQWSPTLNNIAETFTLRFLQDILNPGRNKGFFLVTMTGKQLGPFDLLYDPRATEEIIVGKTAYRNNRPAYDIWSRFAARPSRDKVQPKLPDIRADKFKIEAKFADDLRMTAVSKVEVEVGPQDLRTFALNISRAMQIKSVLLDGAPVELVANDAPLTRAPRPSEDAIYMIVASEVLAAGSRHELVFEHEGQVVSTRGQGVYYVGARSNWYPSLGENFASFDLTFTYPKPLTLVIPGEIVDESSDGDWRTTHRVSPKIRMAGFNLGDYEKVSANAAGLTVDVFANHNLEPNLVPPPIPLFIEQPRVPGRAGIPRAPELSAVMQVPARPDPMARLRFVANDVGAALQFYTSIMGPPGTKSLSVSPIPDTFGQGFPGMIYLSTLAYLNPNERPVAVRASRQQTFYSDVIQAHEVAHQWWGNLVDAASYQDDWIMESLAQYSALMWIEKRKGTKALEDVLDDYREDLLHPIEGYKHVDSAGPLTWGYRIENTVSNEAWVKITYEKGSWIFHMLRLRMGDANFLKMMGEIRKRFEYRQFSTHDLEAIAKEFMPPKTPRDATEMFFENWVNSTGIPNLKVKSQQKGIAPAIAVTGTVEQTEVDPDFSVEVPVEIQFAKGPSEIVWVRTSGEPATFRATVKLPPTKIGIKKDWLAAH